MREFRSVVAALLLLLSPRVLANQVDSLREASANENVTTAAIRDGDTVSLRLVVQEAAWRPELSGPALRVQAFAAEGGVPQIPGPLLRVRQGDRVAVTVRNHLDMTVTVYGLSDRGAADEGLTIRAGEQGHARLTLTKSGTFFYWAKTAANSLHERSGIDSQLNGAIVVDPPGASLSDRIFVMTRYARAPKPNATPPDPGIERFTINGRSWPDTERLTYDLGEAVRWRWINASDEPHPLHLHGQYFQVVRTGDNTNDTDVTDPPLVVTQVIDSGHTMAMAWSPREEGRWLFHCHVLFHVAPEMRTNDWIHEHDALPGMQHMAGLVLGVEVRGRANAAPRASDAPVRRLTLTAGERTGIRFKTEGLDVPGLGYSVADGSRAASAFSAPGLPIILRRGEPVEITIKNTLPHATAVHWHGIELESYFDGVAGFGGVKTQVTPPIAAGQSFVARFTPPRAGTFIYHTHFNDYIQLSTGLYGALLVVDASRPFDETHDKVFVFSRNGPDDERDDVLINGEVQGQPIEMRAGETYRLRLIGILPAPSPRVSLLAADGETLLAWRAIAKDGADLPASRMLMQPARVSVSPGETYDFAFTPMEPGRYQLEAVLDVFDKRAAIPFVVK